ncbi:hypothetical protein ACF1AE_21680 [Streptomyces sp. NPDC014986]|uniref:hypothetical protein n=1 Tax=Streptomyces sp. NPDC014986 TaxID=3364934 RepID=UPI0036F4FB47
MGSPDDGGVPNNVLPFRRRRTSPPSTPRRQCLCGAFWRPGPSSDPAWLMSVNSAPGLGSYEGVTHCQACGRHKLSVITGRDMRPSITERNS